jgi:outer membrane protein assembly factor BamD
MQNMGHLRERAVGALSVLMLLVTTACGGGGRPQPDINPTTAGADQILFERGTTAMAEDDWLRAREYFLQLRDGYPQSALRADARLGIADTFLAEGTIDAAVAAETAYQDFLALYPTNQRTDYAQYQLAMVHFGQMHGPERDQSDTASAIREFEAFISRYPNSDLMDVVRTHLRSARDRLSEAELLVGQYYHGRKWWPGSIDRLRSILDEDPGFGGRDAVYFYLADSLSNVDRREETEESIALFERLHSEFPESEFLAEAVEPFANVKAKLDTLPEIEGTEADSASEGSGEGDSSPPAP